MPGQTGLGASALAMKKLGYTETGVVRFFRGMTMTINRYTCLRWFSLKNSSEPTPSERSICGTVQQEKLT